MGKKIISDTNAALHYLMKKNTVEAKTWLDKHYSEFAIGKSVIEKFSNILIYCFILLLAKFKTDDDIKKSKK